MTAQIPDEVVYLGENYELIDGTWLEYYIYKRYEIDKHQTIHSTNLYRGYFATYEIQSAQLYLTTLHISADKSELIIGNIHGETISRRYKPNNSDEFKEFPLWVKYSPLKEQLDPTGYIVIAQYYDERDYPPPYSPYPYKKLLGFQIVVGRIKEIEDFTQEAEVVREKINFGQYVVQEKRAIAEEFRKKVFKKS